MCSGAKNFRCQWVVVFVFRVRCGSVDPQLGNVKPKRNGKFGKKSGPSKRKRLHDEKQTSIPTPDNKWNKESSAGGTKLTWRDRGSTNCRTRRVRWTDLFFRGYLESDHLKRPRERQPFASTPTVLQITYLIVDLHCKNCLIEGIPTLKTIFSRCWSEWSWSNIELFWSNFFNLWNKIIQQLIVS